MPYKIRKVRNKDCYKVYNQKTKKVFAKCTTRNKAIKQERLLRAIKYSKSFRQQFQRGGHYTRKKHK